MCVCERERRWASLYQQACVYIHMCIYLYVYVDRCMYVKRDSSQISSDFWIWLTRPLVPRELLRCQFEVLLFVTAFSIDLTILTSCTSKRRIHRTSAGNDDCDQSRLESCRPLLPPSPFTSSLSLSLSLSR